MKTKLTQKTVDTLRPGEKRFDTVDSEMSGFLVRTETSGNKTYYIKYRREDGKRVMLKVGDASILTLVQGREHARRLLADAIRGEDPAEARKEARQAPPTLREFLEGDYLTWARANLKSGEYQAKRIMVEFPALLDRPVDAITQWDIERHRAARLKAGDVKPATLNKCTNALRAALGRAETWGMIGENPLRKLKQIKEESGARVHFLRPEQEAALMQAIETRNARVRAERRSANAFRAVREYPLFLDLDKVRFVDHVEPAILVALHLGLRRNEEFSAVWQDIDLDKGEWHVTPELNKAARGRRVPMNPVIREALRAWRAQNPEAVYVFENPATGAPLTEGIRKPYQALLKAAGIRGFCWHSLRHCFASRLVQNGVSLYVVAKLLGHGTIAMVQRHYGHLSAENLSAAVNTLAQPSNVIDFDAAKHGHA